MQFGLLGYSTVNIGDEIQSLAAKQFLPKVDFLIDRDYINTFLAYRPKFQLAGHENFDQKSKLILNGWYKYNPHDWPPIQENIEYLVISIHFSDIDGSSVKSLTTPSAIEFYKKHEPIGCRDLNTCAILESKGVKNYFSGCLTLTLEKRKCEPNGKIFCVDCPDNFIKEIPQNIKYEKIKHIVPRIDNSEEEQTRRFDFAEELLKKYSGAKLVITSRLHCALPCLAFGTPVIFIPNNPSDPRFGGLIELMNVCSVDDLVSGKFKIDYDHPEKYLAPHPEKIAKIRKALKEKCLDFVNN